MIDIVLHQPEIPNNTGTIGRLCVATTTRLHLVRPLGFRIDDKALRRAGLDYWKHVDCIVHDSLKEALQDAKRAIYFSTHAKRSYTQCQFQKGDFLVFGSETRGLPKDMIAQNMDHCYKIPMWGAVRSLNLANAVSIIMYEAFRQMGELDRDHSPVDLLPEDAWPG